MREIEVGEWCEWDLDYSKAVKAYDENLSPIGWLYYGDNEVVLLKY